MVAILDGHFFFTQIRCALFVLPLTFTVAAALGICYFTVSLISTKQKPQGCLKLSVKEKKWSVRFVNKLSQNHAV